MAKPATAAQVEMWLTNRGHWLRSGGDNLLRYLSVMLGHGPQTDKLQALFANPPEWLHIERDGHRVRLVGLTAWLDQPSIEAEEISADGWDMVAELYIKLDRADRDKGELQADLATAEQVIAEFGQMPVDPPSGADSAELAASEEHDCTTCSSLKRRVVALESVVSNLRGTLGRIRERAKVAEREKRDADRRLGSLRRAHEMLDEHHDELHERIEILTAALGYRPLEALRRLLVGA